MMPDLDNLTLITCYMARVHMRKPRRSPCENKSPLPTCSSYHEHPPVKATPIGSHVLAASIKATPIGSFSPACSALLPCVSLMSFINELTLFLSL